MQLPDKTDAGPRRRKCKLLMRRDELREQDDDHSRANERQKQNDTRAEALIIASRLKLQAADVFDVSRLAGAIERHDDGETDRDFGRGTVMMKKTKTCAL